MSSLRERVKKYIEGMERRLNSVHLPDYQKILDLARQYTEDAKYYLERGDEETAIVDVVYAEGLLDAVLVINNVDPESDVSKRVFVGGTFDIIHPGHIEFLKEASRLGRVYVSVARDANSEKAKGRRPINDENQRLEVVKSIRYVYSAFLGDEKDFLKSVEKVKPDVIFLGPDQKVDVEKLKQELGKRGLFPEIVRMKERVNVWRHSSTSSVIKEIVSRYCTNSAEREGSKA
ncbi:MAG: cytidylyltransferase family protein [Candidatus Aramenus sp.]|jgi:FAD synthetase|nr:cytidylyltransferase family protein [Candidatus Aramenus sp.]